MKTAILLSGGMDSIAIAYWKRPSYAITIDYGQLSAAGEIRAAKTTAKLLNIKHEIITVDCRALGSGDLAGTEPIKKSPASEWWAFRNQLLLTLAGMRAIPLEIEVLLFGSVKTDSFHMDGTPDFFDKINEVFVMQEGQLRVDAPAIQLTTVELIKSSGIPLSLLAWAHSCHISDFACGHCRGCNKFISVMRDLGNDTY